jgi:hypothetical protein
MAAVFKRTHGRGRVGLAANSNPNLKESYRYRGKPYQLRQSVEFQRAIL